MNINMFDDFLDRIFPYRVFEVSDIGKRLGLDIETRYDLCAGFTTKELAQNFVDYQATITNEKYIIKEYK